jgi:hypothetical protein
VIFENKLASRFAIGSGGGEMHMDGRRKKNKCPARLTGTATSVAVIAAIAATITLTAPAHAGLIYDGQTVNFNPGGSDPNNIPIPSGSPIFDSGPQNFTGMNGANAVFWGTIDSQVFSEPAGDVFVYKVKNNNNSTDALEHLTLSSFKTYTTDADYDGGTGDVGPQDATRGQTSPIDFGPPNVAGSTVAFDFITASGGGAGIAPGQTTDYLIVITDSSSYTTGNGALIDGAVGNAVVNVPSGAIVPVPEPASISLIGITGGLLLSRRRRDRRDQPTQGNSGWGNPL